MQSHSTDIENVECSFEPKVTQRFWTLYSNSRLQQFEAAFTDPPPAVAEDQTSDFAIVEACSELFYVTMD
jgi:hypothetical protein